MTRKVIQIKETLSTLKLDFKTQVLLSKIKIDNVGGFCDRSFFEVFDQITETAYRTETDRQELQSREYKLIVDVVSVAFPFGGPRTRIYPSYR